jgi:sigma-E processing peptidase SpoIIGA
VLCSLLGAGFSLLMPMLTFFGVVLFLFKLFVGVLLVSLLKKFKSVQEFFVTVLTFMSATFLFGGLIYFVLDALNATTTNSGLLLYEFHVPVGMIILLIYLYAYFMFGLVRNFYKRKTINNYLYEVLVCSNEKKIQTKAFLDTGNRLIDYETRKPVVMINYKIFHALYENISPTDLLLGKIENMPLKNAKRIEAMGVNGKSGSILLFETDVLQIFLEDKVNIIKNAMLGLSFAKFRDVLDYSMLLNPLLFD